MSASNPQQLRPYEEGGFRICDVIDRLAAVRGEHVALKEINRTIAHLAARYPDETDHAIGEVARASYQIAHKAVEHVTTKAAAATGDMAALLDAAVAKSGKDAVAQALQALAGMQPALKRPATVADSGPMSVQKAQKTADPWQNPDFTDVRFPR